MNNSLEILEELKRLEQSVKTVRDLLKWDSDISPDARKKILAHLQHLVRQKNAIRQILSN